MRTQGNLFYTIINLFRGIWKTKQICFIDKNVSIGKNPKISPLVLINENVKIGDNVFIGYSCVIRPNTEIGSDCSFGHLTVVEGRH